jgi:hypothetical protein
MAATMECVNVAGAGAAADHHPPSPLPHRLHLDRRHPHAPPRRQAQVVHPPPPLPHRLHLDRCHPHAPTRRQAQVVHPPPPLPHGLHLDRRHPHAPPRRQAQVAPTSLCVLLTVPVFDSLVAKLSG